MKTLEQEKISDFYNNLNYKTKNTIGTLYDFYSTHVITKNSKNIEQMIKIYDKNLNGNSINNDYMFPNVSLESFVKNVELFSTRELKNPRTIHYNSNNNTERLLKEILIENQLIVKEKDLIKMIYFYNTFPFIVTQDVNCDEHGIPYQPSVSNYKLEKMFYDNFVKRNYENNNLGFDRIEDYFAYIVDKFNCLDFLLR